MANVTLKNIKKVYPFSGSDGKQAKKKKGEAPAEGKANLLVTDKGVVAVQDFNLEIADKEFIVLVGPSGCGKSTTLRMIAGLEEISEGELYIGDRLVNDVAPKDRDIAMVFQNYALYPHITEYLGRKPKALSGGQRQRVAIGRAIVREPKVFLMDEPLSNLDAKLRNQMRAEIIKLRQRIDTTFVYVTHDQTEAMTLGDRIVIMKDGLIQQIGTPQQVFDCPSNLFVAGFIGTPQMNFFDAKLQKSNDEYYVTVCGVDFGISQEKQQLLREKGVEPQDITLGVRPEHIMLCSETALESHIKATVDVSEMMGSSIHLHVNAEGKDVVIVLATVDLPAEHRNGFRYGDTVNFTFGANVVHLFGKDGKNLIY